jgi:DTW domain-containing protein YfiP
MLIERRTRCHRCSFLIDQCVCQWIPELFTPLKIIVLQDSKEAKHAKNTVSLLCLGLPSVQCISIQDQNAVSDVLSQLDVRHWRLVFPCDDAIAIESISDSIKPHIEGIILLDATWRKAKKIYFTEPRLQIFDTVCFSAPPVGQYTIRKSPNDVALSTLEACAYAVEQLSGENMQPLRDFMTRAQTWQWRKQPINHRHLNG